MLLFEWDGGVGAGPGFKKAFGENTDAVVENDIVYDNDDDYLV